MIHRTVPARTPFKATHALLLALALGALSCGKDSGGSASGSGGDGGGGDNTPSSSSPGAASDTGIMPTYSRNLTKIADSLEAVSDEDSARAAARVIAAAAQEMERAAESLNQLGDFQKAAAIMQGASTLIEPNTRISVAMSKIATDHPELIEIIGNEMDNLPTLE